MSLLKVHQALAAEFYRRLGLDPEMIIGCTIAFSPEGLIKVNVETTLTAEQAADIMGMFSEAAEVLQPDVLPFPAPPGLYLPEGYSEGFGDEY